MIKKWPRYCELLLAVWLIASGFVLEDPERAGYRIFAFAAGLIVMLLDGLSISGRFRYGHLLILAVSGALVCFTFLRLAAESQGAQNLITVALLLAMLSILPTRATEPPESWREFTRRS